MGRRKRIQVSGAGVQQLKVNALTYNEALHELVYIGHILKSKENDIKQIEHKIAGILKDIGELAKSLALARQNFIGCIEGGE